MFVLVNDHEFDNLNKVFKKIIYLIFSLLSSNFVYALYAHAPYELNLENYKIESDNKLLRAKFYPNSLRWLRDKNNILSPEARVQFKWTGVNTPIKITYNNTVYLPVRYGNYLIFDLWINLFIAHSITTTIGNNDFNVKISKIPTNKSLIDKSCLPYNLKLIGAIKHEYSFGCLVDYLGTWHKRRKRVILSYQEIGKQQQLKRLIIKKSGTYTIGHKDLIKATFKHRQKRLKLALGLGPYQMDTESSSQSSEQLAPAIMLYGKYDLVNKTSLRFFDAFIKNDSHFNNGGLYFAYELASLSDGNISLTPLIGAQALSFKFQNNSETNKKIIFPQGVELAMRHSFGIKNLTTVFGAFLSNSNSDPYTNLWIRSGKKIFYELNYIKWNNLNNRVKTYGISVGIPLASFF